MKPSKTGKPLPKSQLDFESFSLRPLRYISKINLIQYSKKAGCRQHFSPCAVQRRGAAARIISTQFKAALHKNRPLHKVLCSGLWSCFKGQVASPEPSTFLGDGVLVLLFGDFPGQGHLRVLADRNELEDHGVALFQFLRETNGSKLDLGGLFLLELKVLSGLDLHTAVRQAQITLLALGIFNSNGKTICCQPDRVYM